MANLPIQSVDETKDLIDLNTKRITIGGNVEIRGVVEYSETLKVLTQAEYETKRINAAEIRNIDTQIHRYLDLTGDIDSDIGKNS